MKDNKRTQKTLSHLKSFGFTCGRAEYWQASAQVMNMGRDAWNKLPKGKRKSPGVRKDLFEFIDIVAMRPDFGIVAVQTTSQGEKARHLAKISTIPAAKTWLESKGRILLYTWAKKPKKPDSKQLVWTAQVQEVTLSLFDRNSGPF